MTWDEWDGCLHALDHVTPHLFLSLSSVSLLSLSLSLVRSSSQGTILVLALRMENVDFVLVA